MAEEWWPPEPEAARGTGGPSGGRVLVVLLGAVLAAVIGLNALSGLGDPSSTATGPQPDGGSTGTRAPAPRATPTRTPTPTPPATQTAVGVRTPEAPVESHYVGCRVTLPGLLIGGDPAPHGSAIERSQREGKLDRQVIVVRRTDGGSLGRSSAAVTWPLALDEAVPTGLATTGTGRRHELVWELSGELARIRGTLTEAELISIARTVEILQGKLVVAPPPGYTFLYGGRCDEGIEREVRYSAIAAGLDQVLDSGSLVFTGITRVGSFEDELTALGQARAVGKVGVWPAVQVDHGSAAVAWEPSPGLVAYVGYSGPEPDKARIQALLELARRTTVVSATEFSLLVR